MYQCKIFYVGAVQKIVNLENLDTCCWFSSICRDFLNLQITMFSRAGLILVSKKETLLKKIDIFINIASIKIVLPSKPAFAV